MHQVDYSNNLEKYSIEPTVKINPKNSNYCITAS